jgi:hypothetical protein
MRVFTRRCRAGADKTADEAAPAASDGPRVSNPTPSAVPPAGISKAEAIRRAMTLHRSGTLEEAARL